MTLTTPGGVPGSEIMMLTKAAKPARDMPSPTPLHRGGRHGPDNTTPHYRLHILQT